MKTLGLTLAALLLSSACAADGGSDTDYDQAELQRYRRALPTHAQLDAPRNTPTTSTALGDPAIYPHASAEIVLGINGAVGATIEILEVVTALPPTFYDSSTSEFVWGPWEDDDYGYVAAYIKDTGGTGDFRYEYALLRGSSNDLATLTPIIYGGATPDEENDDYGAGVTVWDMSAMKAHAEEFDPNFDASQHDSGRFAALFAAGPDEDNPSNDVGIVVAAFRDFVPKDEQDAEPVDLDYLYGRVTGADSTTIDFVDWQANLEVSEPADSTSEDVGVRMAFLNEGVGRAEADAINGSLEPGETFEVVECWDTSLNQTFITGSVKNGGESTVAMSEGEESNCGLFAESLDELGVPRLEDVDAELIDALDTAASQGL